MNPQKNIDTIVVGSGPGGASVAKQLTELGQKVLIIEMGDNAPLQGNFLQMSKIAALPGKGAFVHSDLSLVMRGITAGGSSAINFATMVEPPADRFAALDIDLSVASQQIKSQIPITTLPDKLMGPMAQSIQQSALQLGHDWQKLQKFIYTEQCHTACHRCAYGCPYQAKWTARNWLDEAVIDGAQLIENATVKQVLFEGQQAVGVQYQHQGQLTIQYANNVVLAAGGIGTPRILAASGIDDVSDGYFVDPVIAVMGSIEGIDGGHEVPMAAGMHLPEQGITMSDLTLPQALHNMFSAQVGRIGSLFKHHKTHTVMVKVADQLGGKIGPKWINKRLTTQDKSRLQAGSEMAKQILKNAGAKGIFQSHHFAAHPGGSAAIGRVVDNNLQTKFAGLYLCDASVLPAPWGLAPSYTLLCLGHRLAEHIAGKA